MSNDNEQTNPENRPAVGGPVERIVRPQRWTGTNFRAADAGGFVAIGDYLALERAAAMLAVDLAEARAAVAAEREESARLRHLLNLARDDYNTAAQRLQDIGDYAHDHSTGPAVPDALWEVRSMAYGSGA